MIFNLLLFSISCVLLIISGNWLVKSLSRISDFLGLKQFTVAFLLMSIATAAPEMFIGVSSALRGISELSLGNILGQNIIHFTVAIFICVLIRGSFSVRSRTTRITALFSSFMAMFPLILILDGTLSRTDGFILICSFAAYVSWMLKKSKRFDEAYHSIPLKDPTISLFRRIQLFFNNLGMFVLGAGVLILASQGIVKSALFFANSLDLPLMLIGVLIVSLGTALPEVYFSAYAAKRGDGELMAGNLLGATAISTSLVLGLVSMISPITNISFFAYFSSRFTLFVAVSLFMYFMLGDRKISKKEGFVLLSVYLIFIMFEILI